MGLKQDIVIVNEFTTPSRGGKGGSRGGTPGRYVLRYMARPLATETIAPIKHDTIDSFIVRYMARENAIERPGATRGSIRRDMRRGQGLGGVAFSHEQVSLSDERLRATSTDIQRLFDEGHTVLKTVISFTDEYLKQHGLVADDFQLQQAGDYRGELDQMKLRMAIQHGLSRMPGFDDLRYVGVIQVDTRHVHCHLATVDAGRGRRTRDGTQKGKLGERHKQRLRRGVDSWLDEHHRVAHLSSAVGYERRNVSSYVRRWAYDRVHEESLPQFLLACLPADHRLWRAGSNDKRMRKANRIVTELVTEQLDRPGSPMPMAMARIYDYANHRRELEGLSADQWQRIVDRGHDRIIEQASNAVYKVLREVPAERLRVRTPMLEVMGMDYEQLASLASRQDDQGEQDDDNDLVRFGFRLRSYSARLRYHREQAERNDDLARQWERAETDHRAAADSRPLYNWYVFERWYHEQVMAKYRHFLPTLDVEDGDWYARYDELAEEARRIDALRAMLADESLRQIQDPMDAERIGLDTYDTNGGRHLAAGAVAGSDIVLRERLAAMEQAHAERVDALSHDMSVAGLVLREVGPDERRDGGRDENGGGQEGATGVSRSGIEIVPGPGSRFEDVKGFDLHHLSYDFTRDVEVGERCATRFVETTVERRNRLLAAAEYLDRTEQGAAISTLPVHDVAAMSQVAAQLADRVIEGGIPVLVSRIAEIRDAQDEDDRRNPFVTSLDENLISRVQDSVDKAVRNESDVDPGYVE